MNNNNHLLWASILKIVAIYAVILIHSSAPLLVQFNEISPQSWWIGNLYNSLSRWCIPVFFMLSGAFLIEKMTNSTPLHFYQRRFERVLVPFIAWSVIYLLWRIYFNNENLAITSFFKLFFQEPLYYHLWYLYVLVELYLFTPVIAAYVKNADLKNVIYFLILWFVFSSIVPLIEAVYKVSIWFSLSSSYSAFQYVGYFILGYILRNTVLKGSLLVLSFFALLFSFFVTAYLTTLFTWRNDGQFIDLFYEYFSFNVFLMAMCIYLIAKSIRLPVFLTNFENRFHLTETIAACVPGIYFIHAIVIGILKRNYLGFHVSDITSFTAIGLPLFSLMVFVGSFLIVSLLKQMPVIKVILP